MALIAVLATACTNDEAGGGRGGASAEEPESAPTPIERVTAPVGDWFESSCALPIELLRRQRAGIVRERSPELTAVPREPNYFGGFTAFTHSGPWDYLQQVPVALYGPGFIRSRGEIELPRRTTLADLAPTIAGLVDVEWPSNRPGKALTEALVPAERRPGPPKLIVQIVWDGGGWNALNEWPGSWPALQRIMDEGTSIADVEVGSSPSVTPAVHATIGTGAFPKQHGIIDIPLRIDGEMTSAFAGRSPENLKLTTVADIYDRSVDNEAHIGLFSYKSWHWGLIGHGAYLDGADKDIAVIAELDGDAINTNEQWFELPGYVNEIGGLERYIKEVDTADGKADGLWMGNDVLNDSEEVRGTPAWVLYQTDIMKAILENESFGQDDVTDLFFANYKQVDDVGHNFNMLEPEVGRILEYTDEELGKLIRWLNGNVGKRQWVLMVTADHGQGPEPLRSGAWPIRFTPLFADITERFDVPAEELFEERRPGAFWIDDEVLEGAGITIEDIADYLVDYRLEDNTLPDEDIPAAYRERLEEPIFAAAFPTSETDRVWSCAKREQRGQP